MAGEERTGGGSRGGGKLSLKRRRQPEPLRGGGGGGGGLGLPGRLRTLASNSSWFEKKGLSDAENTWITLLRAVDPHLNRSSLEKEISLPEFCTKSSQIVNPQPNPETFNTGTKQFQWIPFPLYHREVAKAKDSRRHQNSENEGFSLFSPFLMGRENSEDKGIISVVPKQVPLTINEHATEESRMKYSIKHSTKLESRERIETYQQNSPGHSPSTTQNHPNLWKGTTTQSEVEIGRENDRSANTDVLVEHSPLFTEATSRLPARTPPSASFCIVGQEKTGDHIPTLDQCPMCQIRFSDTLSKLDIDSHLARCLSESTEDVIW